MKLYTTRATPFGRTVEIVAHELGLHEDIELVETVVAPAKPNPDYLAVTPLRKIPALVVEDGTLIVDSAVITDYLAARVGDTRLFARSSPDHWKVLSRYAIARGIADCAVGSRYEIAARPEDKQWPFWIEDQFERVTAGLGVFEADLPPASGSITIADIALGAALGYLDFRFADYGWRDRFPNIAAWMKPIEARPSFVATCPPI
ncbi:glutathione S-transferase family protein [Acuticoccus sp. M5D2P5]|uniref:glutathione S-transferase family protein n=1 Tax=Acuticoccus kalidii TaxID=2910977 RepID=UPI001F3580CB|nr:glutathione S-transferase family protein [Acuticoccus kalidii]MCF3935544.1 glutathione S-transferase family protein [Acuticoccus kalidii]